VKQKADVFVDQAIHGYQQGHQLLAASSDLDHVVANVIGDNSDSAPRSRVSDGPYLTGYPLPDGRYVVARTWSDSGAERPNTVITRSLLLPRPKSPGYSGVSILEHLYEPTPSELETGHLHALPASALAGPPVRLDRVSASIATAFYSQRERLVVASPDARAQLVMALWEQLWMPARFSLHFCTAPDTSRFSRTDRPLLFVSAQVDDNSSHLVDRSLHRAGEDLASPGSLREFLHFVGSGEADVDLLVTFTQAFDLLQTPHSRANDLTSILDKASARAPARLRRLKRRFLSFDDIRPRWKVDPLDLLNTLARGPLGRSVYAADASIDRWLRYSWDLDAPSTAAILQSVEHFVISDQDVATAADGLATAFDAQASGLITAETLDLVASLSPSTALNAVWERNQPAMWRAWVNLGSRVDVPDGPPVVGEYDWSIAVGAIRHDSRALSRVLRRHPQALDYLIAIADGDPAESDLSLDLARDARRYIGGRLEGDDPFLSGLARLSSDGYLPTRLSVDRWQRLLRESADEVVHATAYLICRSASANHWRVAAMSMLTLHQVLEGDGGEHAWRRLTGHLRGDRHSWDRCGRLLDDYAGQLRRLDDSTKQKALRLIHNQSNRIETGLIERLRPPKAKKFNLFDPSTWI
jgi:hypothetical protein